jgi:hypothetical protein
MTPGAGASASIAGRRHPVEVGGTTFDLIGVLKASEAGDRQAAR